MPETAVTTRAFRPGDEPALRQLNEEWITRFFQLEPKDHTSLADPQKTILADGGKIFFAVQHGELVGCCALLAVAPGEFEVAKMAVTAGSQGAGIGRQLLERVVAEARSLGATRLYLETNHTLVPAICLYRSFHFQVIPPERFRPSPYARADVQMELYL